MTLTKAPSLRNFSLALCLCVLIALTYGPALSGSFIFDDYPIFVENAAVHVSGWHWETWQALWAWSQTHIQRPIAMFSYALNYAFGANPWGFKATNLCIHLLNAVLVWLFARQLLVRRGPNRDGGNYDAKHEEHSLWAFAIAGIWAVHPLQVSAVMYVVQRMELLGFTFVLLALLAYWHGRRLQIQGQHGCLWLFVSAAVAAIGYFAKETALLIPAYALLLELTLLHFAASKPRTAKAWRITYAAGTVFAAVLFFAYILPRYTTSTAYAMRDFNAWQRELTQLRVLCMYLGWSVFPSLRQLHFYYDNYPLSKTFFQPITTLWSGLFLLLLLGCTAKLRRRRPLFALGIGWFFVSQILTSGPFALELVFEHRNYPALFGLTLAFIDLIRLLSGRLDPRLPAILAAIVFINFSYMTVLRAATWGSPLQLALTLAQDNPGSSRAALDLARCYVAMAGDNPSSPMYSLGIAELERGAKLPSSSILPEEALLIQAANHPGIDPNPWWQSLQRKLQISPLGPETYVALNGLLQARISKQISIDAIQLSKAYQIAISRNPSRLELHAEYAELADTALDNRLLATEQWGKALELVKDLPPYAKQLASYFLHNRRADEALAVIAKAQALQPDLREDSELGVLRAQADQQLRIAAGDGRSSNPH